MKSRKTYPDKSRIIAEYLNSDASFKQLGIKYNIPATTIQSWVRAHRLKQQNNNLTPASPASKVTEGDVALKQQLHELTLKNELLEEMLRLSEQMTGIELRKKFGTRQS